MARQRHFARSRIDLEAIETQKLTRLLESRPVYAAKSLSRARRTLAAKPLEDVDSSRDEFRRLNS
jgi:hypothetical protein